MGLIRDVSVSGASIVAPTTGDLQVGSRVLVTFNGVPGTVIIRRTENHPGGRCVYGVEFSSSNDPLARLMQQEFLLARTDVPSWLDPDFKSALGEE